MNIFTENRKANFNYEILEKYQAGLVLLGQEVKSIKTGMVGLSGSYVMFRNNELYLVGCHIPPYQPKNAPEYLPERERKLLLTKKEILYLQGRVSQKGLTFVPLKIYTKINRIKLEFGLARLIKKIDQRQVIKKREAKREMGEFLG
ncbi:MAG: SsrA-binding protein [Parcubacteria group bacterium CG_4_10_14_0_2_um_filter_7_35_8]|nr:MAG: SsrA-binding protein [Parcubacteria group bacterium CG23_combo_of_CG06-09_8_20_14_all_35_6]PIZ76931.1 MAG: SsrA-binding protein [Parcubacteria group bacterium CG_4_10_14_0_2_um_filter_7_35_8]